MVRLVATAPQGCVWLAATTTKVCLAATVAVAFGSHRRG
ncbi:hypothetical protein Tco_1324078, partial [Tanacetum coccineum]